MSTYSIKDLEQLSGIKAHTLRVWEQRYSFIKPKRTGTNIRFYDDNDLRLVLNISLLKDSGHKISKISRMCSEEMQKEIVKLTEERLTFPEKIRSLTLAMIDCDEERIEKIMTSNIRKYGLELTMTSLIFPFMTRLGIMWQTGSVFSSQEHFISNLVSRKLQVAIDITRQQAKENGKKFILFLPEGELHELSLLYSYYLLKVRGQRIIYLGQNTPLRDIRVIADPLEPDFILTVFTSYPQPCQLQAHIDSLSKEFQNCTILITGRQVLGHDLYFPGNVKLLHDFQDLVDLCAPVEILENQVMQN
ncbi:MAG TPA: MerR family transcriptional regulator [Cyclobacteriaceae bacterium]|nr:MerR family transcriptional regulator [Cyclobacteriaceae bacterium]